MKLDATDVRYLTPEEFRVLTAVEMGSKNHEVVPTALIAQISALRHAGISKLLSSLLKRKLVARVQNNVYDGFRLTYGGYDYLAVRALSKRKTLYAVGNQIGIGKESDIYIVSNEEGERRVLKIHRLGRISFRKIKEKRDYMGKRKSASWMYMSRLAAEKEYAFMQILHAHGFPVPTPIDQARHTILMSYEDAYPLRQIASLPLDQVQKLYSALMALIVRLAQAGLIHGDFNEFNLLVKEVYPDSDEEDEAQVPSLNHDTNSTEPVTAPADDAPVERGRGFERVLAPPTAPENEEDSEEELDDNDDEVIAFEDGAQVEPILIDFPQMVSIEHPNAEYYFMRDVDCVRRFFRRRFRFESEEYPTFAEAIDAVQDTEERLDAMTRASGYGKATEDDEALASVRILYSPQHLGHMQVHSHDEESSDDEHLSDAEEDDQEEEEEEGKDSDEPADKGNDVAEPPSTTNAPEAGASLDMSHVASRVAAARAQAQRRAQKHHGRKAQATKTGRRHGGGKAKYSAARTVSDSLQF
ncbi:non-specific serine/threonine protein kinase [Malassezia equina]|uniref:Serine/threonine-protein kinase RIO2 n=1 Tax=Malassezia equina TaxID=1381935 RepID=A0AAF0ECJ6_9BASI|nr:non-specific serine/threonine protein kinase [Malassezia equina]